MTGTAENFSLSVSSPHLALKIFFTCTIIGKHAKITDDYLKALDGDTAGYDELGTFQIHFCSPDITSSFCAFFLLI